MSILFRCPCGRSMVMEEDRAGAIVTCPNCKRALRVPSGKDRGVQIAPVPAASKTRTSRTCPRCNKEVPVDSQICPSCKQILAEEVQTAEAVPAAAPVSRPAMSRLAAIKGTGQKGAAGARTARTGSGQPQPKQGAQQPRYGARSDSFGKMPASQRTAFLVGGGVVVLILIIAMVLVFVVGSGNVLADARTRGHKAIEDGRKLESTAKFDEAYEGYLLALSGGREDALRHGQPDDVKLAGELVAHTVVLQSLVSRPRTNMTVQWKPQSNQELQEAREHNKQHWGEWQKMCLEVAAAGTEAAKVGKTAQNQSEYEAKVGQTMQVFSRLVANTDDKMRAQHSFQQMLSGLRELGSANRHWDEVKNRNQYLANAGEYFSALHDFVTTPGYPDDIW